MYFIIENRTDAAPFSLSESIGFLLSRSMGMVLWNGAQALDICTANKKVMESFLLENRIVEVYPTEADARAMKTLVKQWEITRMGK